MATKRISGLQVVVALCLIQGYLGLPSPVNEQDTTDLLWQFTDSINGSDEQQVSTAALSETSVSPVISTAASVAGGEMSTGPGTSAELGSTSEDPCKDTLGEEKCLEYEDDRCFLIYEPWARAHCAKRCGYCVGEIKCYNKLPNCPEFGNDACKQYPAWGRQNCREFCNLCTVPVYYNTTPASTVTPTTTVSVKLEENETVCRDVASNCDDYDDQKCFGQYEKWARAHCNMRCGFCKPAVPIPCVNKLVNCEEYTKFACTDSYSAWARKNCREYCGLCSPPVYVNSTGIPGAEIAPDIQENQSAPTGIIVPATPAGSKNPTKIMLATTKSVQENWAGSSTPGQSHPISAENKIIISSKTTVLFQNLTSKDQAFCQYNGHPYAAGETWFDACNYQCQCLTPKFNRVICIDRCPNWIDGLGELTGCTMEQEAGECCKRLECPTEE